MRRKSDKRGGKFGNERMRELGNEVRAAQAVVARQAINFDKV